MIVRGAGTVGDKCNEFTGEVICNVCIGGTYDNGVLVKNVLYDLSNESLYHDNN